MPSGMVLAQHPHLFSDPPSLDAMYPQNHTIVEGENLALQCRVTAANPEPNITWYSVTANSTALSYGANLTFVNISRFDAGMYYCVVGNGIGKAVTSKVSTVDVLCKLIFLELFVNCLNFFVSMTLLPSSLNTSCYSSERCLYCWKRVKL